MRSSLYIVFFIYGYLLLTKTDTGIAQPQALTIIFVWINEVVFSFHIIATATLMEVVREPTEGIKIRIIIVDNFPFFVVYVAGHVVCVRLHTS